MEKLDRFLYWALVLFIIYMIFEVIRKIFGGSLGFDALLTSLVVSNIALTFYIVRSINQVDTKISGHIGWHKGRDSKKLSK